MADVGVAGEGHDGFDAGDPGVESGVGLGSSDPVLRVGDFAPAGEDGASSGGDAEVLVDGRGVRLLRSCVRSGGEGVRRVLHGVVGSDRCGAGFPEEAVCRVVDQVLEGDHGGCSGSDALQVVGEPGASSWDDVERLRGGRGGSGGWEGVAEDHPSDACGEGRLGDLQRDAS